MSSFSKYRAKPVFVGGVVTGAIVSLAVIRLGGLAVVSRQDLDDQQQLIADLQKENYELTNDLFNYQGPDVVFDTSDLHYDDDADAAAIVSSARRQARNNGKFLMVTFGANWCVDCRTLYHNLHSPEVRGYTAGTVDFVNVNVGKFTTNLDLAAELGVDLSRGIPVAIFFAPDGQVIGTTNEGQLEPARFYSSKQILKFVRDIVEKSLITAPDGVH
jgi:thioredoxin-related protein